MLRCEDVLWIADDSGIQNTKAPEPLFQRASPLYLPLSKYSRQYLIMSPPHWFSLSPHWFSLFPRRYPLPPAAAAAAAVIRMLYEDLSKVVPLDQQTLCLQLLEETEPSIRCALRDDGSGGGDGE